MRTIVSILTGLLIGFAASQYTNHASAMTSLPDFFNNFPVPNPGNANPQNLCGNNSCNEGEEDTVRCFASGRCMITRRGTCPSDCIEPEHPEEGGTCANFSRSDNNGPRIDKVCIEGTCGDGICEAAESQCRPSTCSGISCSDDCGALFCRKDCDANYDPCVEEGICEEQTEPEEPSEPQPVEQCVNVIRDRHDTELCALCGNGICEDIEKGVAKECLLNGRICFRQTVRTECPADCSVN